MRPDVNQMTGWGPPEWRAWAGLPEPSSRPAPTTVRQPFVTTRLVGTVAAFAVFGAVVSLLPFRLPGEVPPSSMFAVDRPLCQSCPASQQITAAGVRQHGRGRWLTVAFAAPPQGARFEALMENDSAVTIAQQESGWTMSAPADAVQLGTFQVAGRGATAVFELPSSYAGGVALRSSDGARFPQSGWLPLSAAPQSRRNWVDALILIAVITGALLGFRAGAAATGVQLLVLAAIVAGVRVLGSLMPPSADPRQFTSMLAVCAGVGVAGIVAHLAIYRVAGPYMLRVRGDIANRAVGVPLGGARMLIAAAMLLALGSDLAMFDAFYASVRESQAGTWLVELWRSWIS